MHCGTGDLAPLAPAVQLANRPVHVSLDPAGRFLLAACNMPSEVMVYRLAADGRVAEMVEQTAALDTGIFAHQVLAAPSGRFAVLPTRGNDATEQAAEEPGALKIFHFHDGQLSNAASIASNDGYGFGPRHAEFHPSLPVIYVVTERGNQLLTYAVTADGISAAPLASSDTVRKPGGRQPVQFAGALRVHPNGRSLYVLNRSDATVEFAGRHVHSEGENTVAVFAIERYGHSQVQEQVERAGGLKGGKTLLGISGDPNLLQTDRRTDDVDVAVWRGRAAAHLLRSRRRAPAPPPFSGINSIPACSRAVCNAARVRV